MKKAIIGKKVGMTQIFDENGRVIPVTVVEAGPCVVVQKKTIEKDGYETPALAKWPFLGLLTNFSLTSPNPTCIAS